MKIDLTKRGLRAIYPLEYECNIAFNLLSHPDVKMTTGEVHFWLTDSGYEISRASVIQAMKRLVSDGILGVQYESCQGGERGVYQANCDLVTFWQDVETRITLFMSDAYAGFRSLQGSANE